ncbi:hypothetical protein [Aurantiacibacter luteus]|uniref:TonB C-terminal domain-containing protein n=1 Tax=Aurantiacibacter luteus TaxID=1581420 RepID=A0A0G9MUX4_9SPHN|nr:hypothetical protein [Aurantiacibacter luteus]KLE34374.1 hypothetical protein AAW00_09055 [Aurantiacibacter luteus]
MQRLFRLAMALAALAAPVAAPAQESDLSPPSAATRQAFASGEVYRPVGLWARSSSERRCGVIRDFERNGERVSLQVQRLHPHTGAQFVLAGTDLQAREEVSAAFWPSAGLTTFTRVGSATIGERPGIYFAGDHLPSTVATGTGEIPAAQRVGYFVAEGSDGRSYVLETGPVHEALTAIDSCVEARLDALGIDLERHAAVSEPARIADIPAFTRELQRIYRDHPNREGRMWLRIGVDSGGRLVDCASSDDLMPVQLQRAVCAALGREGRLVPARDAAGEPMTDFFFQAIGFEWAGGNWPNADGTDPYR